MIDSKTDTARRIIIIDDNQAVHRDFESILVESMDTGGGNELEEFLFGSDGCKKPTSNRYELGFASQGQEGVRMIQQALAEGRPYMVAFVDIRMPPGWDGLETIEHIWEVDPDVQVVICSAYCDYSLGEMTDKIGMRDNLLIIEKPFGVNEIKQAAATLTEKSILQKKSRTNAMSREQAIEEKIGEVIADTATQCRQVEDALSSQKKFLTDVFSSIPDGICIIDKDMNILRVNKTMEKWYANAMPLVGKKCQAFHPTLCSICPAAETLRTGKTTSGVVPKTAPDGAVIGWIEVFAYPMLDDQTGQVVGVIKFLRDITERRNAEDAAQKACSRFERMCSSNVVGVVLADAEGGLQEVNDYYLNLLGFTRSEFEAGQVRWDERTPDEHRYADLRAIEELRATGICTPYEKEYVRKDGSRIWVLIADVIVQGPDEQILALVIDITKRKDAENAARKVCEQLEKANRELSDSQAQLVRTEKLISVGHLAAGVAHEINNPVGFVACNFEVLESYTTRLRNLIKMYEELAGIIPVTGPADLLEKSAHISEWRRKAKVDYLIGDMPHLFKDSKEGLDRITAIVQNMRSFSSINLSSELGECNINEAVQTTVTSVMNDMKHCCEFRLELGEVPCIICHAGQINQVLLNIIVNASQAIESQARADIGTIVVKTCTKDDAVVCVISDDGPGIPQEHWAKIFDPFFTTKPVGKGTGLGLSVSYDIIVNKHNGQLLFESTPEKGTTFTIELPLRKAASKETSI